MSYNTKISIPKSSDDNLTAKAGVKELLRKLFVPNETEIIKKNLSKSISSMEYNIDRFEKRILSSDVHLIPEALFRFKDFTRIFLTQFTTNFDKLKKIKNPNNTSVKTPEELKQVEENRVATLNQKFDSLDSKIENIFQDLKYFDKFISLNKNKPLIKKINSNGSKLITKLISIIGSRKNSNINDINVKGSLVNDFSVIIKDYENLINVSGDIVGEPFSSFKEYVEIKLEDDENAKSKNDNTLIKEYSYEDVEKIYNDLKYFDKFINKNIGRPLVKKLNIIGSKLINKLLIFVGQIKADKSKFEELIPKFDSIYREYLGLLNLAKDISYDDSFSSFEEFASYNADEDGGPTTESDNIFVFDESDINNAIEIEKNAVNSFTRYLHHKKLKFNPFRNSVKPIRINISNEVVKLRKIISELKDILDKDDKNMLANVEAKIFLFKISVMSIVDYLIQLIEKYRDLQRLEVIDPKESIKIDTREISLLNKLKSNFINENNKYLENISLGLF